MPSAISRKQQQQSSGGRICGANKSNGEPCKKPAGWGTEHPGYGNCKIHWGATPANNVNASRQRVTYEAKALLGLELVEDPHRVLLRMVYYANAMTQWLAGQVAALEHQQRDMDEQLGDEEALTPQAIEAFYTERTKLGRVMHVYITAFAEERDRAARTAKMAIDAGVAERLVQVEEAKAMLLARTIQTVLDDLDLNDTQRRKAPAVVRARLMELEAAGGADEAEVEFARKPAIRNIPERPDPVDPDRPYVETMGATNRKRKKAARKAEEA